MITQILDYLFLWYEIYMAISFICSLCLAINCFDKSKDDVLDSILEFFVFWVGFPMLVYFILTRYVFKTKL